MVFIGKISKPKVSIQDKKFNGDEFYSSLYQDVKSMTNRNFGVGCPKV